MNITSAPYLFEQGHAKRRAASSFLFVRKKTSHVSCFDALHFPQLSVTMSSSTPRKSPRTKKGKKKGRPSSLASVVRNRRWKVGTNSLTLFHEKFWGKSMDGEESRWRESQIGGDQDQDEIADMDDDVISGCYFLDIGIPDIGISRLWIRADYIRIFDYIQSFYEERADPMVRVPSVVLTGQPGIGESSCIASSA